MDSTKVKPVNLESINKEMCHSLLVLLNKIILFFVLSHVWLQFFNINIWLYHSVILIV